MKSEISPWDFYLNYKGDFEDRNRYLKFQAEMINSWIVSTIKTKFVVGEFVLLNNRDVVVITKIQPIGYITVPSRIEGPFRKTYPAIKCDINIYQYKYFGRNYSSLECDGQTTENYLTKIEDEANEQSTKRTSGFY